MPKTVLQLQPGEKYCDWCHETGLFVFAGICRILVLSHFWGELSHGLPFMDNQAQWMKDELAKSSGKTRYDHVFVTFHTPMFPNGGHVQYDMFYSAATRLAPRYSQCKPRGLAIMNAAMSLLSAVLDAD